MLGLTKQWSRKVNPLSGVDAFECVCHFSCFHNLFLGSVADSFNDTTILSGALLPDGEFAG